MKFKAIETGTVLTKEGVINIKSGQYYDEECFNANKNMFADVETEVEVAQVEPKIVETVEVAQNEPEDEDTNELEPEGEEEINEGDEDEEEI